MNMRDHQIYIQRFFKGKSLRKILAKKICNIQKHDKQNEKLNRNFYFNLFKISQCDIEQHDLKERFNLPA